MQRDICSIQLGAAVIAIVLLAFGMAGCNESQESGQRQMPPAPVVVMHVQEQNVDVMRDYPARVHGSRQVQVRARVEGILRERHYQEGRMVSQGELLFRIDPERYEIAVRRAEADLADARANLNHAQREWNRYSALYAEAAVSELERDRAMTELERAQARFAQAEVTVADARRNLGYTEVRAPVGGLTDMESLSEGNLIEWGGLLTTITQHDPVHVRFSMPENDALLLHGNVAALERVDLLLPGGGRDSVSGEIDFTAGTIDARTGTVAIRAIFANPDQNLIPGQFVRVLVTLQHLENVVLVPESAVVQGRETTHLFIVDAQDTARVRPVRLGPVIDGRQVVLDGLQGGDRVVISGQVALREGAPVNIIGEEAL